MAFEYLELLERLGVVLFDTLVVLCLGPCKTHRQAVTHAYMLETEAITTLLDRTSDMLSKSRHMAYERQLSA